MIKLRTFAESDIESITRFANDPDVSRYMSSRMPYPYTREDAIWWIEFGAREMGLNYAIDLDGTCIGVVGVRFGAAEQQYAAEIGYWVAREHWGKGYASAAVSAMTREVLANHHTIRLTAPVYSPNLASMKVLEKCGYRLEAIHRKAVYKNDQLMDEHIFVIFRDDETA